MVLNQYHGCIKLILFLYKKLGLFKVLGLRKVKVEHTDGFLKCSFPVTFLCMTY